MVINHATVWQQKKILLKFSGPCRRVRPAKLTNHSAHSNLASYNKCHYLFKIFPRFFWLVKTTRIIHHNQLCHIEPMMSKVQPAADYWTDDVKSPAHCRLLNFWLRKPGDEIVLFSVSTQSCGCRIMGIQFKLCNWIPTWFASQWHPLQWLSSHCFYSFPNSWKVLQMFISLKRSSQKTFLILKFVIDMINLVIGPLAV